MKNQAETKHLLLNHAGTLNHKKKQCQRLKFYPKGLRVNMLNAPTINFNSWIKKASGKKFGQTNRQFVIIFK